MDYVPNCILTAITRKLCFTPFSTVSIAPKFMKVKHFEYYSKISNTYFICIFTEREYRCLGQWKEDNLIYTYTERRDLIGYECFVGLITQKGDIFLKEAGNNCERGQEPLKYGMRLTQVSKCYSNPRIRTSPPTKRPKATALPRWRERELNNYIDSSAPSLKSFNYWLVFACVLFTFGQR